MKLLSGLVLGLISLASTALAQNAKPTPVNVHNFVRAETDRYFGKTAIDDGAFGQAADTAASSHRSTGRRSSG